MFGFHFFSVKHRKTAFGLNLKEAESRAAAAAAGSSAEGRLPRAAEGSPGKLRRAAAREGRRGARAWLIPGGFLVALRRRTLLFLPRVARTGPVVRERRLRPGREEEGGRRTGPRDPRPGRSPACRGAGTGGAASPGRSPERRRRERSGVLSTPARALALRHLRLPVCRRQTAAEIAGAPENIKWGTPRRGQPPPSPRPAGLEC
ncbi:PREDICTED: uncharacterized protein LOC102027819 [Chinchilla lanigera]|uniref:uncharacterized protein LOC102027819 n=1 Tax=Chinchilla lanigera TaxID=34839 RepID=UPI0006980BA9|nr:PREDICTED: uncharacterized protein LOC102027819 [Chinchilla lanigera]